MEEKAAYSIEDLIEQRREARKDLAWAIMLLNECHHRWKHAALAWTFSDEITKKAAEENAETFKRYYEEAKSWM